MIARKVKHKKSLRKFNEQLAGQLTSGVGTMWCAYAFFLWALLPLVYPAMTDTVAYVSQSIVQLVLLPVIMVGQAVQSRRDAKREERDHRILLMMERMMKDKPKD